MDSLVQDLIKREVKKEIEQAFRQQQQQHQRSILQPVLQQNHQRQTIIESSLVNSSVHVHHQNNSDRQQASSSSSSSSSSSRSVQGNRHGSVAGRLSNLLTNISKKTSTKKGQKNGKPVKIQVRWSRYFEYGWETVTPTDGGGHRFITLDPDEDQTFGFLKKRALDIYFSKLGKNCFGEAKSDIVAKIVDVTDTEIPSSQNIPEFLKSKGLYPSRTWFILKTEGYDGDFDEIELSDNEEEKEDEPLPVVLSSIASTSIPNTEVAKRKICSQCSCTYVDTCISCEQNEEYSQSLFTDQNKGSEVLALTELRERRLTALPTVKTFEKDLKQLRNTFQKKDGLSILIRRSNIYNDVLKRINVLFRKKLLCPVKVEFTSLGSLESGIDTGGPGKEMLSLFYMEARGKLLYGEENKEYFMHDILKKNDFFAFGKLVALAILHKDYPTPRQLCAGVAGYIVGNTNCLCHIKDIADIDIRQKLHSIEQAKDQATFNSLILEFPERFDCGILDPPSFDKRSEFLKNVAHHFIISTQHEELQQFLDRLGSNGVLEMLRQYPIKSMGFFTFNPKLLDPEVLKSIFVPKYSQDSFKLKLEEDIVYNWFNFIDELASDLIGEVKTYSLQDLEQEDESCREMKVSKKLTMSNIILFLTGSTYLSSPPPKIDITFEHGTARRFSAITCTYELKFSVSSRYTGEDFTKNIVSDILDTLGFGVV